MQTFNNDYLKQLVDGDRVKYYQASGTARPVEGVRDVVLYAKFTAVEG